MAASTNQFNGLIVYHGGYWVDNVYHGGEYYMEIFILPPTYDELLQLIYDVVDMDRNHFELELSTLVRTKGDCARQIIKEDKDLEFVTLPTMSVPTVYAAEVEVTNQNVTEIWSKLNK